MLAAVGATGLSSCGTATRHPPPASAPPRTPAGVRVDRTETTTHWTNMSGVGSRSRNTHAYVGVPKCDGEPAPARLPHEHSAHRHCVAGACDHCNAHTQGEPIHYIICVEGASFWRLPFLAGPTCSSTQANDTTLPKVASLSSVRLFSSLHIQCVPASGPDMAVFALFFRCAQGRGDDMVCVLA